MSNLSTDLRWEATPPGLRDAYDNVSRALDATDFYLAGGTALALIEGHRVSVDLDFFAPEMANVEALLEQLRETIQPLSVTSISRSTLYVDILGIPVSFLEYRYPLLSACEPRADHGRPLASRDDIAAMKLSAIASRGSRKDFVDLWILLTRHRSLSEYLELYQQKFATRDVGHVVRSLVYFEEADQEPPLRLLIDIDWANVRRDITGWVEDLLRSE